MHIIQSSSCGTDDKEAILPMISILKLTLTNLPSVQYSVSALTTLNVGLIPVQDELGVEADLVNECLGLSGCQKGSVKE